MVEDVEYCVTVLPLKIDGLGSLVRSIVIVYDPTELYVCDSICDPGTKE